MIARSLKRCARLLAAGWNRVRGRRGSIAFGQLSDATCTDLILSWGLYRDLRRWNELLATLT